MKTLLLVALLGCLASVFAEKVRWCVTSDVEEQKCQDLVKVAPDFACERRSSIIDCLVAIKASEADAITLDGGEIYTAGLDDYDLHPIIAEDYTSASETCYYAVAVAKKGTLFGIKDLKGKKTCHTGLGKSAGWNIPIGSLLSMNLIQWQGADNRRLEDAVSDYFGGSCVPGAPKDTKLCDQCIGDCSKSHSEPYYNYDGAFRCLKENKGDVAFVKHLTVPDAERDSYELLCLNNERASLDNFATCNLARVPAHAVVTRKDSKLEELIWTRLNSVQNFDLFSSEKYNAKNLMFKDSTKRLIQLPANTDSFVYLGAKYIGIIHSLRKVTIPSATSKAMKWCVVGTNEAMKCDKWSFNTNVTMRCIKADTPEDCLKKIMRKEADAVAVDGGQVYTAGKCGLVPAMVEQYNEAECHNSQATGSYYYAVAVIKKGSGLTWNTLQGKKSCHTGIGRNAGWNIPMGRIYEQTHSCNLDTYFSSSCAPGANISSSLCSLCIGNEASLFKCKPSDDERYNGYNGAFRCLVEGAGDVAFIKHSVIFDNSAGDNRPQWAQNVNADQYQLVCPGKEPVSVNEYMDCHLAKVTAHAVVTRPEMHDEVVQFLKEQQALFANNDDYNLFKSDIGKNLLFKDSTKCLQEVPAGQNYEQFLGPEYLKAMNSLRQCDAHTSDLEKSCSFHSCQSN